MKKHFFVLLAFLVCTFQTSRAYVYFTIYFSDGTKSEAYYATDVDSICYSKIGLDSLEYLDWQVQEIYTCDSVYRYPLAQIDSLSFKDVDINKVAEDIAHVCVEMRNLFNDSITIEELRNSTSFIQNIEGVEKAWIDNQTLFLKIRDYDIIPFLFPVQYYIPDSIDVENPGGRSRANNYEFSYQHDCFEAKNACIANQTIYDEAPLFRRADNNSLILKSEFESIGISCNYNVSPTPEFFSNGIFNYDLSFIITHGAYDKYANVHWLYTSEIIDDTNPELWDENTLGNIFLKTLLKNSNCSPTKKSVGVRYEIRGGKRGYAFYTLVSEKYILSSPGHFNSNGKAIVFNVACESLKGNDNMAKAFIKKGAGCYMGFTDVNSIGDETGKRVFENLMAGKSVYRSCQTLPDFLREEICKSEGNKQTIVYYPKFKCLPYNSSLCITHPETLPVENLSSNDTISLKLCGRIKKLNTFPNDYIYGFQWSTYPDMSEAIDSVTDNKNYDDGSHYMTWEKTLGKKSIRPNKTYYYRAYMNDGYSNCFGEIKSFKSPEIKPITQVVSDIGNTTAVASGRIKGHEMLDETMKYGLAYVEAGKTDTIWCDAVSIDSTGTFSVVFTNLKPITEYRFFAYLIVDNEKYEGTKRMFTTEEYPREVYYVLTEDGTHLTCFYDGKKNQRSGDKVRIPFRSDEWYTAQCITTVTFDSSFRYYRPSSTAEWFHGFKKLTSFEHIENLNTAEVTNMKLMFAYCESLKSLDLSNFKTSNVKNMDNMFLNCDSLTNLNISNFNTSNTTSMGGMFARCYSLTNLDLSSFNTSNVTNLDAMFLDCYSLRSLDLSSFNTSNVTEMGRMFISCRSLTSLDLSNFNTNKVEHMGSMFKNCSSLQTLDLSNFDVSKADATPYEFGSYGYNSYMFENCSSLKTIYAKSWNIVDDRFTFYGCNNLVGGRGTKIGENFYGYDSYGNPQYYYCGNGGDAARIDGGKDSPGLFTAK